MRSVLCALFALFMTNAALAEIAEGTIKAVDNEKQTVTLDDGSQFKLSSEFDFTALTEGVEVTIAYDLINGVNIVTDMQIWE